MDLFDIIPENFFTLLAGKNKRLYLACLIEAFKTYETGSILGIDKKVVVDELCEYLDNHRNLVFSREDSEDNIDEDEEEASKSSRSLAYFVLRRFEQTGWIYIDITGDYEEILNFTDSGISMVEAIMNLAPWRTETFDFNPADWDNALMPLDANEYNGYIHTIYMLLNNAESDYGLTIQEVFRNTKLLIRALRKLDSRMKDYIETVIDNTDIHDLIEKLMNYKVELIDNGYKQLKTGDNINKYRLSIVTNLEKIEANDEAMYKVTDTYLSKYPKTEVAYKKAYKDIDEMIDVFNELDSYVTEIDRKNTKYIDSTIGKIKFLLSEDDNTIGKLNDIFKYIKISNKDNHIDKAIDDTNKLFSINDLKIYNNEKTLYSPRGKYDHIEGQTVDLSRFDLTAEALEFFKTYENPYNDDAVRDFLYAHMHDGIFEASDAIKYNSSPEIVLMTLYALVYGSEHNFDLIKLDKVINHERFVMHDFILREVK